MRTNITIEFSNMNKRKRGIDWRGCTFACNNRWQYQVAYMPAINSNSNKILLCKVFYVSHNDLAGATEPA